MPDEEDVDVAEELPAADSVLPGSAHKIVFLKLDEHGVPSIWENRTTTLPLKVYDRKTAIKYAAFEAHRLPVGLMELIVAVISPGGRCVALLAGSTGKPVRPLVALRTKRALAALMPSDVRAKRRTSRPVLSTRTRRPGKRRTSRR